MPQSLEVYSALKHQLCTKTKVRFLKLKIANWSIDYGGTNTTRSECLKIITHFTAGIGKFCTCGTIQVEFNRICKGINWQKITLS